MKTIPTIFLLHLWDIIEHYAYKNILRFLLYICNCQPSNSKQYGHNIILETERGKYYVGCIKKSKNPLFFSRIHSMSSGGREIVTELLILMRKVLL